MGIDQSDAGDPAAGGSPAEKTMSTWEVTQLRGQRAREAMVATEEVKILMERVKECYYREGVNHYRNCEDVVRAYAERIARPALFRRPAKAADPDE